MKYLSDLIYDNGLNFFLDKSLRIYLLPEFSTSHGSIIGSLNLGDKPSLQIEGIQDLPGGGRQIIFKSFTDGTIDHSGTVTHFAIQAWWFDNSGYNSEILAVGTLDTPIAVAEGESFPFPQFSIQMPSPV